MAAETPWPQLIWRVTFSIFEVMSAAQKLDTGELPLVLKQDALVDTAPLKSKKIEL